MIGPVNLAQAPGAAPQASAAATAQINKIRQAAEGFERTLLRHMLQELRSSSMAASDSPVSQGYAQIGDDHLAEHLARAGGLGLAQAMTRQLMAQVQMAQLIKPT
jgi:Rod binding domain-containing protein